MKRSIYGLFLVVLTVALATDFVFPFSVGQFLNPFDGVWALSKKDGEYTECTHPKVCVLKESGAKYSYDQNGALHVYALGSSGLYFAQGYLTAKDRLFQMDLQTRLMLSRLSELIGRKGLKLDQFFIRLGMRSAIQDSWALLSQNPEAKQAIESYIRGVNAYVVEVKRRQVPLPLEYHLLGETPNFWTPLRVVALVKLLDYQLSGYSEDLNLTRLLGEFSWKELSVFFKEKGEGDQPFLSEDFKFNSARKTESEEDLEFRSIFKAWPKAFKSHPNNGSNNWAVHGNKTKSGKPILANDPHLSYTNPLLFYEVQLTTPNSNAYGLSVPGAPGVVLGFNSQVAWGSTNGYTDVWDWYDFKLSESGVQYWHGGKWRPVIQKDAEVIKVKKQGLKRLKAWFSKEPQYHTEILERVSHTHLGPIVDQKNNRVLVSHWIGARGSQELVSFLKLNSAKTVEDCEAAFQTYVSPTQNILCADSKSISLTHVGGLPLRKQNQGLFVADGAKGPDDFTFIPEEDRPYDKNPKRGFVYSANQRPTPEAYPHYMSWRYGSPYRGKRIEQRLMQAKQVTPFDMMDLQSDKKDLLLEELFKDRVLPYVSELNIETEVASFLNELSSWNFELEANNSKAAFVFLFWEGLREPFCKLFLEGKEGRFCPPDVRLMSYVKRWSKGEITELDKVWLKAVFKDASLVWTQFLQSALQSTYKQVFGQDLLQTLDQTRQAFKVPHLLRVPFLEYHNSQGSLGSERTVLAHSRGSHGPVFQMVVHMSDPVEAWINRPGINRGEVFHPDYFKQMNNWVGQKHHKVLFLSREYWRSL